LHLGGSKTQTAISVSARGFVRTKRSHCVLSERNYWGEDWPHTPKFNPPSDGEYFMQNKQTNYGRKAGSGKLLFFCSHIAAPAITSRLTFIRKCVSGPCFPCRHWL